MEELVFLFDFINLRLLFIIRFLGLVMGTMLGNSAVNKLLLESQAVECIWTIIPAVILIQIAMPSLLLLYISDEAVDSALTLKVVGHQWYWSYEYSDF
jgi:cytochrome c oxidase subunit 2